MKPSLLSEVENQLALFSDTPALDASVLLSQIINKPRTWVMAHPELKLTADQKKKLSQFLERLKEGESFPYVLGHWEFFGLDFNITPDVLIPRPETELLVEQAITWLQVSPQRRTVADVGTGSGCIAVTLSMHVPEARFLATDISLAALKVARSNALKFHVAHQIDFLQCDLLPHHIDPLPTDSHFDLICANLPYIPSGTLRSLPIYGHEPILALDGGSDGLNPFRRLLALASEWLAPNGLMLLEIEASQGIKALSLAYDAFSVARISLHQDLAGRDRLIKIEL